MSDMGNPITEQDIIDLHWMARRYADWRSSYATSTFNHITRRLIEKGLQLNKCDGTLWARDSMGHQFGAISEAEHNEVPPDMEGQMWQNRISEAALTHAMKAQSLEKENQQLREERANLAKRIRFEVLDHAEQGILNTFAVNNLRHIVLKLED